jgi:hypothetical protein
LPGCRLWNTFSVHCAPEVCTNRTFSVPARCTKCLLLMFMYTCAHKREIRTQTVCRFYKRTIRYILFHNRRSGTLYHDVVSMELPLLNIQSHRRCVYKCSNQKRALLNKSDVQAMKMHVLPTSADVVRHSCVSEGATWSI